MAVMGGGQGGERIDAEANRATASVAAAELATARSLRLDQPARRDEVVTTPDILVRGQAGTDVARIRVTLESRGGKILASDWIDRTASDGGELFPFEARFEATTARPAGVMWITATALGADGIPIDALRRRFQLGEIPAERSQPVHTTGEDGVMGGIPFGTNFLPEP